MNLIKFKTQLDKINRYYEYIAKDGEVSNIERDAMMVYIRNLYDLFFEEAPKELPKEVVKETPQVSKIPTEIEAVEAVSVTTKKRPKLVFTNTQKTETPKVKPVEKKVDPPKVEVPKVEIPKEKPIPVQLPIVEKKEEPTKIEEPKEKPRPKIEVKPILKKEPEPKVEEPAKEEVASNAFNEEYEELFLFKEATDISQKLSEAPIEDLSKALGLNEKFLYINELFGGNAAKFKAAIDVFNEPMDSFEGARAYMEKELVEQFGWVSKLKKTVAKDFVKLVRRRYL